MGQRVQEDDEDEYHAEVTFRLEKAPNARDLGGYLAADGRRVRRGVLFRADSLHRLSEADLAAVGRLGLSCLIDFRNSDEITQVGPDRLPEPPPSRLVSLPLSDPEHSVFASVAAILGRLGPAATLPAATLPAATLRDATLPAELAKDPVQTMCEVNRWFVTSSLARQTCAAALRIIADPHALPLLFHCTAGKDRTGWLSAVILTALGVSRADVLADYQFTNEANAASNAFLVTMLGQRMNDPESAMPLLEARPEYLQAALDEADRRYGDMDGYLHEGLGLDDATLVSLRANLLESS